MSGNVMEVWIEELVKKTVQEELRRIIGALADMPAPAEPKRPTTPRGDAKIPKPRKPAKRLTQSKGNGESRGLVEPFLREYLSKNRGPHTTKDLMLVAEGKHLKVTEEGVRLHLRALLKAGELKIVGARQPAVGRGRGQKIYQATGIL